MKHLVIATMLFAAGIIAAHADEPNKRPAAPVTIGQPVQQPPKPAAVETENFGLAYQQLGVSSKMMVDKLRDIIAAREARIVELEKLCGDLCKPKEEKK